MTTFATQRRHMVERQVAARGVCDPRVLAAMREVPREMFVDDAMREYAYEDSPLPIDVQQTISQPYIVALMIEAAELGRGDRVLEIGAGSGYAAAVMGRIAEQVYAIERHVPLARLARRRLLLLGYDNVKVRIGDGSGGWPEAAPFDAIIASAGVPRIPDVLRRQLAIGGRLVMPVGDSEWRQRLLKLVRTGQESWSEEELGDVLFVPMIGEHGWQEEGEPRAEATRIEPARTEPTRAAPASRPAAPARDTRPVSIPALIAAAARRRTAR